MPNCSLDEGEQLGMLINLWPEEFRELEAVYGETISAKMLKNVVKIAVKSFVIFQNPNCQKC